MNLNTSHPLYGNLKFLFCVDESNNPVDLVTPSRVFTPHANSVRGTGTWGRHFGVRRSGSTTTYGTALDPFTPANNTGTLLIVTHSIPYSAATMNASLIGGPNNSDRYLPRLSYSSAASGVVGSVRNATTASTEFSAPSTTAYIGATPRMWTFTRNSTTAYAVYVNATAEVTGTSIGTDNTAGLYSYIGGTPGSATLEADIVWIAWFDVVLTPTQVSDLYASLGANNAFALVEGGAATPITFSGSVANQTGTEGAAFSLNLSTYFSGTETPFAYSVQTGTLPAGLSLNSSTGVISGTPTTAGVSSGIVIRATDATPDTADTNSFTITINAANTSPSFTGPSIDNISATEGIALSSLDVSPRFSDAESALTFSAVGSWPAGVTVSSAGVISGAPTTAGTYASLQVRATDAGSLTADSNAFTITVAAAAVPSVTSDEFKNNTGTLLPSATIPKVWLIPFGTPDYTNLVTNGAGELVISEAGLSGDYLIVTANADGTEVGVSKATAS